MGSANTIFRKQQITAKHAKPYKEIPFPNTSHIQRRIVPQEELEAFQTEEADIVANMHKLMKQHYKIQENKNASQEKGVFIEPTLEEKIAMAKLMDANFNEEKYRLSRQIREANKENVVTLNQEYLRSVNYKRNLDIVNGAKLTSIFNQHLHLASPNQVSVDENIKKLALHNKISEDKLRSLLQYYDVPAWHYNKHIVDMKIGYDRLGPLPGTE